jgi:sugar-specific transcriptional regulator TrmB
MTAMEVSEKARVPYSKIYKVLNSLEDQGWVNSVEERPSKYYPKPPLEALAAVKIRFEDTYKDWEQTITRELQPLYDKRELVEQPDILILRGKHGIMAKLEEIFRKARKEIMIAAPEFAKDMVSLAIPLLKVLQKTRANVMIMISGRGESWKNLKELTGIGELRVRDEMFGGGIIIDGKEAMLFLGGEKPSLVIWSDHVGLVRFAREYFQFLWESSEKFNSRK